MPFGSAHPRVRVVLAVLEATAWLTDYLPKIFTYLDEPKTLEELQNGVGEPSLGYETHYIVEAQKNSIDLQGNARHFADRIDARENLVRVPYRKHVEISSWYSRKNVALRNLTPRDYLRGKSWNEQYEVGLQALRLFGVLKSGARLLSSLMIKIWCMNSPALQKISGIQ